MTKNQIRDRINCLKFWLRSIPIPKPYNEGETYFVADYVIKDNRILLCLEEVVAGHEKYKSDNCWLVDEDYQWIAGTPKMAEEIKESIKLLEKELKNDKNK